MTKIRLHIPGLAHTITNSTFSHCAFTGKILRFGEMMLDRDFEVYYYGVSISTSEIKSTKSIEMISLEKWLELRKESLKFLNPQLSTNEVEDKLSDPKTFYAELCNVSTPLYTYFNNEFNKALKENYRSKKTDIVCLPFGPANVDALRDIDVLKVESGIGYTNSYEAFRIFESYAIMHQTMALESKQCQHYWFVVPNYYNSSEWQIESKMLEFAEKRSIGKKRIGFFGRICQVKGMDIIISIASKFPNVDFIICGQGDYTPYVDNKDNNKNGNIFYKPPIHGEERVEYLSSLHALLAPSIYCEPFCGVNVEAQLCGTPVISNEFGALVETVEQFKTGMLCHTLADFCVAIEKAINDEFDRDYIAERARLLYDMKAVGKKYEYVFKSIIDIENGNGGWYSDKSHINVLE